MHDTLQPMKAVLALLTITLGQMGYGQDQLWYFGDGAALSFSGGSPTAIPGSTLQGIDNMTAISGQTGQVMCYSNGFDVFDATHNLMMNGDAVGGSNNGGQCALLVPRPLSSEYYLFTVGQWNSSDGLRFSVIDMTLNGGLGAVTIKGQSLLPTSTERLEAVRNPNDGSWWLLTHAWNSDEFLAYHVTSSGLDTQPVVSAVGSVHSGGSPWGYNAAGQLTASHDGSLLACGIYSDAAFEVFDFDPTTGSVSNPRVLPGYTNAWGAAFSPDGSKLYVTKWYDDVVIQLDLSAGTWIDVQASATVIGTTTIIGSFGGYEAGYLEAGPDGKIYVAKFGQDNISVINFPNNLGAACDFVDNGVPLGMGNCRAGLCRTVSIYHGPQTTTEEEPRIPVIASFDPSTDHLMLRPLPPGTRVQVTVLNDLGRTALTFSSLVAASMNVSLPCPALAEGWYVATIHAVDRRDVARFLVAR